MKNLMQKPILILLAVLLSSALITACKKTPPMHIEETTVATAEPTEQRYEWSINDIKDHFYIDGEKVEFPIDINNLGKNFFIEEEWCGPPGHYEKKLFYKGKLSGWISSKDKKFISDRMIMIDDTDGTDINVCGITFNTSVSELEKYIFADCEFEHEENSTHYLWKSKNSELIVVLDSFEKEKVVLITYIERLTNE